MKASSNLNYVKEVQSSVENRFEAQGYMKAIEWLACFMVPGKEDIDMFGAGVDFVADKYNQGINTVAFDVTVYAVDAIHR